MPHKITPSDIHPQSGLKHCHAVPIYLREEKTNAKTHNAKNMYVFETKIADSRYIVTATDADPFGWGKLEDGTYGFYNKTVNEIIQCHMLRSGRTGKQGSGKIASAMCIAQAIGGDFNYKNFNLITYSNGFVVSTTMDIEDSNIGIYKLISEDVTKEYLPIIQDIIGNFKFKDYRKDLSVAKNGEVTVIHLVKGSVPSANNEDKWINILSSFNEFCFPNDGLNVKIQFRNNHEKRSNMYEIFNSENENVTNRVSGGITVKMFEELFALYSLEEKNLQVEYEYNFNGVKYKVNSSIDVKISFFPGIKTKKDKRSLVNLRNASEHKLGSRGSMRQSGSKGGHDIADSGHRILVCFDSFDNNLPDRPTREPVLTIHDSCADHSFNYTDQYLGYKAVTKNSYEDFEKFFKDCKELEENFNFNFNFSKDSLIVDSENKESWKEYVRIPFLKIWINVNNSSVYSEESCSTLLCKANLNNCFYVPPDSRIRVKELIKNAFICLTKKEDFFKKFKKLHALIFPQSTDEEMNSVPISLILGNRNVKSSVSLFAEFNQENPYFDKEERE